MNLECCIDLMSSCTSNRQKIEAARLLKPYIHDSRVMDALCEAAVTTDCHAVREVLMEVLQNHSAGAWLRFSNVARWSRNPVTRKWALVNLSLMGCRDAKNAVISGLYDPDAAVRRAAALSAGLYVDKDVLNSLERYFETHRFALTLSCINDGLTSMRKAARRLEDDDYAAWPASSRRSAG